MTDQIYLFRMGITRGGDGVEREIVKVTSYPLLDISTNQWVQRREKEKRDVSDHRSAQTHRYIYRERERKER